jgi:hypothetical protein
MLASGQGHDVCITFDHNCANDYRAVHVTRTTVQTYRLTTTSTQNLMQTATDTLEWTATSTICRELSATNTFVHEVVNPSKSYFGMLGGVLIAVAHSLNVSKPLQIQVVCN